VQFRATAGRQRAASRPALARGSGLGNSRGGKDHAAGQPSKPTTYSGQPGRSS